MNCSSIQYGGKMKAARAVRLTPLTAPDHSRFEGTIMAGSILPHCARCGAEYTRSNPSASKERFCSVACRFWSRVDRAGGDDACWPFIGAKSNFGYGSFRVNGKSERGHRIAWTLTNGPIPSGMYCCHKCDNPVCCNPSHLFLGTARDNVLDMLAKGRHVVTPEGIERARQAKLGRPCPPHVIEAIRRANVGRKQSKEEIERRVAALQGQKRSASAIENMRAAQRKRRGRERDQGMVPPGHFKKEDGI